MKVTRAQLPLLARLALLLLSVSYFEQCHQQGFLLSGFERLPPTRNEQVYLL